MVPALKIVPEYPEHADRHEEGRGEQKARSTTPARGRRRANLFVVLPLVGLLLLGSGLGFVAQRVQLMSLTYELDAAQQQLVRIRQEHARLLVAQATAASLDKLESTARTRLGMVEPGGVTTVVLEQDTAPAAVASHGAPGSTLADLGAWLQQRLMTTAEAGERRR